MKNRGDFCLTLARKIRCDLTHKASAEPHDIGWKTRAFLLSRKGARSIKAPYFYGEIDVSPSD
ncbi:MAG TPA: hypothetical protein VN361_05210 [Oxalicibacterium sp.]|jgi:hypothetical protein|nr:hypothetical protein [Oxalicibacterium sp.]